jgi:hypothetical protein
LDYSEDEVGIERRLGFVRVIFLLIDAVALVNAVEHASESAKCVVVSHAPHYGIAREAFDRRNGKVDDFFGSVVDGTYKEILADYPEDSLNAQFYLQSQDLETSPQILSNPCDGSSVWG